MEVINQKKRKNESHGEILSYRRMRNVSPKLYEWYSQRYISGIQIVKTC
jgi:hypothetical protein